MTMVAGYASWSKRQDGLSLTPIGHSAALRTG
jgi:hypothetical protein